jgi:3-oxoacyl-[acyl-carrier protein] reductase
LIAAGKTLARELGPKGIRVNSVSPGLIESEMVKSTIDNQELDSLKARLFLKRLGYAEEVAKVIHFLVSNDSSYITGQNIFVDGGMSW